MSREERRAYQRMMKNSDPYAPSARVRQRSEKLVKRRERAAQRAASEPFVTPGWLIRTFIVAFLIGLVFFSTQWPEMPFALYVGLIAGGIWFLVAAGIRRLRRRALAR
jgi:protein-S-isoprenylcysteine O-methyltransferase Ste14